MQNASATEKVQKPPQAVSDLAGIRRDNLRKLASQHGGKSLAQMLGQGQSSFISQMAGPNPTREVSEKTVRMLEVELNLAVGTLDRPIGSQPEEKPVSAEQNIAMVSAVIRSIGNICIDESVELPTNKLTDIIALAIIDAMEHEGNLREDHIRQVVRLLK